MDFIKEPMAIENRSMELIAPHLEGLHLDERETKLYSRLIHASGDVGYAPITRVHPEAIDRAIEALAGWIHPDRFDERMAMKTLDEVNRRFLTVPLDGTYLVDLKKP